jgi:hypothetical protein
VRSDYGQEQKRDAHRSSGGNDEWISAEVVGRSHEVGIGVEAAMHNGGNEHSATCRQIHSGEDQRDRNRGDNEDADQLFMALLDPDRSGESPGRVEPNPDLE